MSSHLQINLMKGDMRVSEGQAPEIRIKKQKKRTPLCDKIKLRNKKIIKVGVLFA